MEDTDGICPFCQQELPISFKEKLDEYFDVTYTEQIQNLNLSIEKYEEDNNRTRYLFRVIPKGRVEPENFYLSEESVKIFGELRKMMVLSQMLG